MRFEILVLGPAVVRASLALTILAIDGISGRGISSSTMAPLEDDEAKDFVSSKLTFSLLFSTLLKVFNQLIRPRILFGELPRDPWTEKVSRRVSELGNRIIRFRMKLILIFSLALLLPGFNPNFSLRPVEGWTNTPDGLPIDELEDVVVAGSRGDFFSFFLLKIPADGIGAIPDGPGARIVSFTYLRIR